MRARASTAPDTSTPMYRFILPDRQLTRASASVSAPVTAARYSHAVTPSPRPLQTAPSGPQQIRRDGMLRTLHGWVLGDDWPIDNPLLGRSRHGPTSISSSHHRQRHSFHRVWSAVCYHCYCGGADPEWFAGPQRRRRRASAAHCARSLKIARRDALRRARATWVAFHRSSLYGGLRLTADAASVPIPVESCAVDVAASEITTRWSSQ